MSENVLTALIGGVVTVIVAVVGVIGVWLGKKAASEPPPLGRRKMDKTDQLTQLVAEFRKEQTAWQREVRADLRKDLADAKAEWAIERQRYIQRIGDLESKVRSQEREIFELRAEIATLRGEG